jgi:hypothetical protein
MAIFRILVTATAREEITVEAESLEELDVRMLDLEAAVHKIWETSPPLFEMEPHFILNEHGDDLSFLG